MRACTVRLTAVAAAVAVAFALSGCGESDPSSDEIPAAAPSESPPPSSPSTGAPESPVDKPTLPGASNDAAGKEAFAEYVVRAWEYALATNDFSAMDAADPARACEPCEVMRDASKERAAEESYIDDPAVSIKRTDPAFEEQGTATVGMLLSAEASKRMNGDGTVEETNRASPRFYFEVTMKFEGDHFQMTRFQVG